MFMVLSSWQSHCEKWDWGHGDTSPQFHHHILFCSNLRLNFMVNDTDDAGCILLLVTANHAGQVHKTFRSKLLLGFIS